MQSAFDTIIDAYDYETCKEIVNHGCQSGVCSQHIYYADSLGFFNKYPDEITRYVVDELSIEFLKDTLERNNGYLDGYLIDLTWAFIELVCDQIVDEYESTTQEELNNSNELQYAMFGSVLWHHSLYGSA